MPRALFSLSDKTGAARFARALHERGWTILSTGGTAAALRDEGVPVTEVSEVTGHPEMMEGRVKTLHPAIHAGLLFRRDDERHRGELEDAGYGAIDLLAVNLYPFRETIARSGTGDAEAIENIDIGGPAMLRAAAKNHADVWAVVDPEDYDAVLDALEDEDAGRALRRRLAARAFAHTSAYDDAIADYLARGSETPTGEAEGDLPRRLDISLGLAETLRYGENPQQRGGWYAGDGEQVKERVRQHQGKELSYNNLLDLDAALLAVSGWPEGEAVCAIVKHGTPCGIATAPTAEEAYRRALETDPESAFGSIVTFSVPLSAGAAGAIAEHFVEVVASPGLEDGAAAALARKKNLRLLEIDPGLLSDRDLEVRRIFAGFLAQDPLVGGPVEEAWSVATEREPGDAEADDLAFAWRAVAAVKSNAILIARGGQALGIGGGQTSRVEAVRQAIARARQRGFDLEGAVLASDAFFPFPDGLEEAARAGIRAVVQPGGSVRDAEVVAAANAHDIAMVMTGRRLFRH
jgi:phosphoribosylaminoimidazolecarboxamide formyltransferase / IMP cyclohydrolase